MSISMHLRLPDHPRACGENISDFSCDNLRDGSPPRMRGKPQTILYASDNFRITPAHAGKTSSLKSVPCGDTDHPRACGENLFLIFGSQLFGGSPPRMRGKLTGVLAVTLLMRITPAHAGKTILVTCSKSFCTDHPRACGENLNFLYIFHEQDGSPPRMRGKHGKAKVESVRERITPAHAGKTGSATANCRIATDHPRACGENSRKKSKVTIDFGSPPRMRGKPFRKGCGRARSRITPAHAGKTGALVKKTRGRTDHPRACGENGIDLAVDQLRVGSPPRMRGKPGDGGMLSGQWRITPAHAGKTDLQRDKSAHDSDHPRACGENKLCLKRLRPVSGSPPRMRGKRLCERPHAVAGRITPAHAGKT